MPNLESFDLIKVNGTWGFRKIEDNFSLCKKFTYILL